MSFSNFHTHTTYCDGKNTPRELVEQALELGCRQIGFSGHSYTETGDAEPYCMTPAGTRAYKAEIRALQSEYRDRIEILLGLERDAFSVDHDDDYDFVIGSVHYVYKDGVYLPVDESRESQIEAVNRHYGGDFYGFVEDYYRLVGDIDRLTNCDVVGHFDLITKFNEPGDLFDVGDRRYREAAERALNKLMHKGLIFEINYGAIARGYRTTPYPDPWLQDLLRQNGEKLLFSSDCHDKDHLLFGIGQANDVTPTRTR